VAHDEHVVTTTWMWSCIKLKNPQTFMQIYNPGKDLLHNTLYKEVWEYHHALKKGQLIIEKDSRVVATNLCNVLKITCT
jgi:hypothetical protein